MRIDFLVPTGRLHRFAEIVRFYQAALVNTVFGFAAYAVLLLIGANPFLAQALAMILGVTFNYVTYSRHVFRGSTPAKWRFALSYAINYLVSVILLAAVLPYVRSPYVAGIIVVGSVSVLNYLALRYLVFHRKLPS